MMMTMAVTMTPMVEVAVATPLDDHRIRAVLGTMPAVMMVVTTFLLDDYRLGACRRRSDRRRGNAERRSGGKYQYEFAHVVLHPAMN